MNAPQPPLDSETTAYLRSLKMGGVHLGLGRMQALIAALGHPERRMPVIHIAGTNGKGSVAAMVEAILRSAGWRTGLYTSPHLVRLAERVQVDRQPITTAALTQRVGELRQAVERGAVAGQPPPSYFEFMTALAFSHFAETECDIAVIEVGMGGRLDATNVVTPEVAAITSIGLDHCEFLGTTLTAIAGEKAGIIKPERPVVIGRLPPDAERVIRAVAANHRAPVVSVAEVYGTDADALPATNLAGEYQRVNAATAALIAAHLAPRWRLTPERIAAALQQVEWVARWQQLEVGGRRVIVDSSHNAEGAAALDAALAKLVQTGAASRQSPSPFTEEGSADYVRGERAPVDGSGAAPIVVIGALGTQRAAALLAVVCRYARELRLVVPAQARACSHAELEALIPRTYSGSVTRAGVAEVFPGPGQCLPGYPRDVPVLVTGSIYLAGEVLAQLEPHRGAVEHSLQDF